MATVAEELSKSVADVAARVAPSVVGVGAGGSGVVVGDGVVVTNAHNLRHDEVVVTFADGRRADGRPAGVDVDGDLAVVSVDTGDAPALAVPEPPSAWATPCWPWPTRVDAGSACQRGLRLRTRRRLPGPRRRTGAGRHRAHRAPRRADRREGPWSTSSAPWSGSTPTAWATASIWPFPPTSLSGRASTRSPTGTCPVAPDWGSPSHPRAWPADSGSRSASPSGTGSSSTPSKKVGPPIVPGCARATSW